MEPKQRPLQREAPDDRGGSHDDSCRPSIRELRQRFASFRKQHKSGARIPNDLRAAVFEALQKGDPPLEVLNACRITLKQLDSWRRHQGFGQEKNKTQVHQQKVRVFSVSDGAPLNALERAVGEDAEGTLELRLGQWSICIRQPRGVRQ
jgi:hypothetical protein